MIEIYAIGGYAEFGRNMTAIRVDDEFVIIDMGLHLENYIQLTEDEDLIKISKHDLERTDSIPNIKPIKNMREFVKAIIPTHAHLDHVGSIPFLAKEFNCPIIGTPFTLEVVKTLFHDEGRKLKNKLITLRPNSKLNLTKNIEVEFINMSHSTPQTVVVSINTKYGSIVYTNDFKLDLKPTLGKKPNLNRLKKLGKEGKVLALITDSTYSEEAEKTPSENIAKEKLDELFLEEDVTGKAVLISTFSSHLARLSSILKLGKRLKRKVVFLGRSLTKYIDAGENAKLIKFSNSSERYRYRNEVERKLKKVMREGKEKYLLVVTGHQGEPKAMLSRLANDDTPLILEKDDVIVFSSSTIPVETNLKNMEKLLVKLKEKKLRIFNDIHVSGHAAREDLREMINMTNPKHIIPAHGNIEMLEGMRDLAKEMDYDDEKVHILENGKVLNI